MKFKLLVLFTLTQTVTLFSTFDITPYKTPIFKDELIVGKINQVVSQKLRLKEDLYLVGTGAQMMDEIKMLALDFDYAQEVDLKAARNLLVVAIQSYLDEINQTKEIRKYLKNYPFTATNVEIGIYVHKPDGTKVSKDKLYYLSAINGVLYYYLDDPKNVSRILFHKESFDEALKTMHNPQS